ncbi:MAG TPA: DUF3606 domain-containing protein [Flavipsychrobacter sp.]|nr:DUF3606 domain-containing protein [Flavipsychrobacter sp.]
MDNMNFRGGRDRDRVSANQPYEVRYLSEKFGVEKQIVMDAIKACSGKRKLIEDYLKERTGRGRGDNLSDARNAP